MKKLLFFCMALSASTLNYLNAHIEGPYAQVIGGANWAQIKNHHHFEPAKLNFKTGYLVGGSIGYHVWNGFRLEAEYSYRDNRGHIKARSSDDSSLVSKVHGKQHTSAVLANLLWELPRMDMGLSPYVGGGVGYAWNQAKIDSLSVSKGDLEARAKLPSHSHKHEGLAWQVIAGVSVPVTCQMDLGIEYRYFRSAQRIHDHHLRVHNHDLVLASKFNF